MKQIPTDDYLQSDDFHRVEQPPPAELVPMVHYDVPPNPNRILPTGGVLDDMGRQQHDDGFVPTNITTCACNIPEKIMTCKFKIMAENSEELDIYQMCAFVFGVPDELPVGKGLFFAKAIFCLLFQTIALVAFEYDVIANDEYALQRGWQCESDKSGDKTIHKLVAFIASSYIGCTIPTTMYKMDNFGLYEVFFLTFQNCPPFISKTWIYIGFITNWTALFLSLYGSFLVIYFSPSTANIVLNSVAIFFVLELDDMLIDKYDYMIILEWCNKINPINYMFYVSHDGEYNGPDLEIFEFSEAGQACQLILFYMLQCILYLSMVFAVIIPWIILVCY